MPRHFQVGETAVIGGTVKHKNYAGRACTIIEPLRQRLVTTPDGSRVASACYVVQFDDGAVATASAQSLAKHFEAGSWKTLREIWQPKREPRA